MLEGLEDNGTDGANGGPNVCGDRGGGGHYTFAFQSSGVASYTIIHRPIPSTLSPFPTSTI